MAGAVRTLARQPARAAGAGERGESTEGGYNGGGTGDIGEDKGREIEHSGRGRCGGRWYCRIRCVSWSRGGMLIRPRRWLRAGGWSLRV